MRVLIAEDDPVARRLLESTLIKWGCEVIVCCDGQETLSRLETGEAPAIAILDWMMPGIAGPEVCRRIRENNSPIYLIMLTAKNRSEDLIAGLQAGADDFVTKPFHQQELYARLQVGMRIMKFQHSLAAHVQDLEVAMMRLRRLQQTLQLEAIGQLASGVAHEINTPIQYVADNMRFIQQGWQLIQRILPPTANEDDISYFLSEVPRAIDQSLEGLTRVGKTVRAMRDFSHPAREKKVPADINHAIETTLTVTINEWKYVAEVQTDLDRSLPPVLVHPGEIHQVFLNLVVNAAHAIGDVVKGTSDKGLIRITTQQEKKYVVIRISDSGAGIREEHRSRIFEPFFTTKDVGTGSGQGLAITHSVIVKQHHGTISFQTEVGKGTTFTVRIPLDGSRPIEDLMHEGNLFVDDDADVLKALRRGEFTSVMGYGE